MDTRLGGLAPNQRPISPVASDAIDRIGELLRSAIDHQNRITERISNAIDRVIGPIPTTNEAGDIIGGGNPMPIAVLLGELERAQTRTNLQIDRLKDAKL